jgi:hypothetical protein
MKNDREATMRLKTGEGDFEREREKTAVEELMQNEEFAEQTIRDRLENVKF